MPLRHQTHEGIQDEHVFGPNEIRFCLTHRWSVGCQTKRRQGIGDMILRVDWGAAVFGGFGLVWKLQIAQRPQTDSFTQFFARAPTSAK